MDRKNIKNYAEEHETTMEGARRRIEKENAKRKRDKFFYWMHLVIGIFIVTLFIVLPLIVIIAGNTFAKENPQAFLSMLSIGTVLASVFFYLSANHYASLNKEKAQFEKYADSQDLPQESKDIISLMRDNSDEIREYFSISKNQARQSFWLSVGSAFFGLLLFAFSIFNFASQMALQPAIITAIGGGIFQIVSILSLHIHKYSLQQQNHYYSALHENEQFLSAVHLVSKLPKEQQAEIHTEIIRSSLKRLENTISIFSSKEN